MLTARDIYRMTKITAEKHSVTVRRGRPVLSAQ